MNEELPIRHLFDLGDLSQAGSRVSVVANDVERARLAEWAGVGEVRAFAAEVELRRLSRTRFAYEAELKADIVQSCVVTLEPVASRIAKHIARELQFSPRPLAEGGELTLSSGDDEVPESIASLDYDLAGPLLEEFTLAIDPYPRKQGASFAPPADAAKSAQSPFAVLKRLKESG